jgi:hypothetical protein
MHGHLNPVEIHDPTSDESVGLNSVESRMVYWCAQTAGDF